MTSKSKESVRTGKRIKRGEALDNNPSRANAPAVVCKQRNLYPRLIAEVTAKQLTRGEVPKKQQKL